jgi:hypothetical protein
MYILVIGTPLSGFSYVGPFTTNEEAENYGEKHYSSEEWWVSPLIPKINGVSNGFVRP